MNLPLLLALLCLGSLPASGVVVINEILSSNASTNTDENGDYSDWIELYNSGSASVSLNGWGLSDDPADPMKWVLPNVSIAPGAHLLVWASDKNRRTPGSPLHTNYKISQEGDTIVLTRAGGVTEDLVPGVAITTDHSYGRSPDGSSNLVYFNQPTPGQANGSGVTLLGRPALSHSAGFYTQPLSVTVQAPDAGVALRYTTDGSTPGESSTLYSGPITVQDRTSQVEVFARINTGEGFAAPNSRIVKATVLRVRAFKQGAEPSEVATATYFVGPQFQGRWEHPVISIAADYNDFFGAQNGIYVRGNNPNSANWDQSGDNWERVINFEFFEADGHPVLNQRVGARIHGGASRARAKKSLRIYARAEYGQSHLEHRIFPEQPDTRYKRLILRNGGNDADRSILRDGFMQGLVGHMRFETMAYRPSIVFINGEYWGIHNIRERYDKHFFEREYGVDPENIDHLENNGAVEEGTNNHYVALREYIRNNDPAIAANYEEIGRRMDIDDFLDYQVAQIYLNNTDWPGNNVEMWRLRSSYDPAAPAGHDGRLRWLLYDTDFGYNLYWDYNHPYRHETHNTLAFATMAGGTEWPNPDWSTLFLRRLLRNDEFKRKFILRMADQLNTGLNAIRAEALLFDYWDRTWPGYPDNPDNPAPNPPFEERDRWSMIYNGALSNQWTGMRTFARQRPGIMRGHLRSYFGLGGYYSLTVAVSPEGAGGVRVNTVDIGPGTLGLADPSKPFPWSGIYFRDVPVTLTALPAPGFRFAGWSGIDAPDESATFTSTGNLGVTALFEPSDEQPVPAPHPLLGGAYRFDAWSPDEAEGSFPASMIFLQSEQDDPMLADPVELPYAVTGDTAATDLPEGFPYNNASRTRINGLGQRGIRFINTGRGRDLGAAVLALDTRGCSAATVQWTASTEVLNSRVYAMRLQYRIGNSGAFQDLLTPQGGVIEYSRASQTGVDQQMGPHPLPAIALGQAYVQLRWKYYFTGERITQDSGARDALRLDDIIVRATGPSFAEWQVREFPNPADRNNPAIGGPLADPSGNGVTNLMRYALDLSLQDDAAPVVPVIEATAGAAWMALDVPSWKPDLTYIVDVSANMSTWAAHWSSEDNPGALHMGDTLWVPVEAGSQARFYRIRVELKD